jgi:FkbM family methyltransferase
MLGRLLERVFNRGNRELRLRVEDIQQGMQGFQDRIVDALDSVRRQYEARLNAVERALREEIAAALEPSRSDIYGTPPTLRPIPGWRWTWGVDTEVDPLTQDRRRVWDSLTHPVFMRWFADLLIMIWPNNESSRALFLTGTFEPNELTWVSQSLATGMTMIDVGANMGVYSMFASKLVGESGLVVAVEPSTRDFQRLASHVTLNGLHNVRCLQVAASDDSKEAILKIASDRNSGHNTFGNFSYATVEGVGEEIVQTRSLDSLVVAQGLQRVDLIKIDVEGHELRVLAGAVETLTHFRPRVLIEIFEEALCHQGASAEAVLTFLEQHGYVLHEFSHTSGELVPLSRSRSNESRNVVALPEAVH